MDRLVDPLADSRSSRKEVVDISEDIFKAQQALQNLREPDLHPVPSGETKTANGVRVSSQGFFQISLDPRAVEAILTASGVRQEDFKDLAIEF